MQLLVSNLVQVFSDERNKEHRAVFAKMAVAELVYMRGWKCVGILF